MPDERRRGDAGGMVTKLFGSGELAEALAMQVRAALERVAVVEPTVVRLSPEQVIDDAVNAYAAEPLAADWEQLTRSEPREVVQQMFNVFGERGSVPALSYTFHVPIQGAILLTALRASTYSTAPPLEASLNPDGVMSFEIVVGVTDEASAVLSRLASFKRQFDESVSWSNGDIKHSREALRMQVAKAVGRRKAALDQAAAVASELQIPIRHTLQGRQLEIPVQRKTIRVADKKSGRSPGDPVLGDDLYEDVLRTLTAVAGSFERLPATAAKFDEEELRDLMLFHLNANYEGGALGEVFNGAGKTDILIPHGGRNAFIGECKFWRGPEGFRRAIDQLLGYTVWRDTKAALIVFVRNPNASEIIAKADKEIRNHSCYVSSGASADASVRRDYVMHQKDDEGRLIRLALLIVVIRSTVA